MIPRNKGMESCQCIFNILDLEWDVSDILSNNCISKIICN